MRRRRFPDVPLAIGLYRLMSMWERGGRLPTQNESGRSTCFCGASLEEPSFTEKSKPHTSSPRTSSSFEFAANRSCADL